MNNKFIKALNVFKEMFEQRGKQWEVRENPDLDTHLTLVKNKDTLLIFNLEGNLDPRTVSIPPLIKHIIFCTKNKLNKQKLHLTELLEDNYDVEYFTLEELQYNVTKHRLVPKHVILKQIESERLLQALEVETPMQFPYILTSDPVIRFLGGKKGQIVEITGDYGLKTYRTIVGEELLYDEVPTLET
jgi:DNA-directed RNA polymerase subunit H (RpoH/RPB5)